MRTSHFLFLEPCDASMAVDNIIRFIIMKEWPLFKPRRLKRLINYLRFTKSSLRNSKLIGWCGTDGILGKATKREDEEPAAKLAISTVLMCNGF